MAEVGWGQRARARCGARCWLDAPPGIEGPLQKSGGDAVNEGEGPGGGGSGRKCGGPSRLRVTRVLTEKAGELVWNSPQGDRL